MQFTNITTLEGLRDLYEHSAMTWEGLVEEDFELALKECGGEGARGFVTKGKDMNRLCHLTGNNAYPDNLTIFSIYPFKGLAMMVGARWMDDIIDNNAYRENWHPFEELPEEVGD